MGFQGGVRPPGLDAPRDEDAYLTEDHQGQHDGQRADLRM